MWPNGESCWGHNSYEDNIICPVNMDDTLNVGFDDCDWISAEQPWEFWKQFENSPIDLELHVPCRKPLEQVISQCAQKNYNFDCDAPNFEFQVRKCGRHSRFSYELTKMKNIQIKCFDAMNHHDDYLSLMSKQLQTKSHQFERPPVHRPHNKTANCILEKESLIVRARREVMAMDIHKFCDKCIGSKDDLFASEYFEHCKKFI